MICRDCNTPTRGGYTHGSALECRAALMEKVRGLEKGDDLATAKADSAKLSKLLEEEKRSNAQLRQVLEAYQAAIKEMETEMTDFTEVLTRTRLRVAELLEAPAPKEPTVTTPVTGRKSR